VRGIGVAVMFRTWARALGQRRPLLDPEPVLLVDDGTRGRRTRLTLISACVPTAIPVRIHCTRSPGRPFALFQ